MNSYTLRLRRSASRAGLLFVAGLAFIPSAPRAETTDEIVSANIAATGAEAIARIENFTNSGSVTVEIPAFGKLEGTLEAVRVPGRGYFETVQLGPISQQKGWDGDHSWERGPTGLRMLAGYEGASLALKSFPNTFVALRQLAPAGLRIEQLEDAEVNGRPQYALTIDTDGAPRSTVYIDRETKLLSRSMTVRKPGEVPVVVDVGDYEAVEGVMMPTSLTITIEGTSTTRVILDSTVVNTPVDESIFAVPSEQF